MVKITGIVQTCIVQTTSPIKGFWIICNASEALYVEVMCLRERWVSIRLAWNCVLPEMCELEMYRRETNNLKSVEDRPV